MPHAMPPKTKGVLPYTALIDNTLSVFMNELDRIFNRDNMLALIHN